MKTMKSIGTGKTTMIDHSFTVDIHRHALAPTDWVLVITDKPPYPMYTSVWPLCFEDKALRIKLTSNPVFKSRQDSELINRYVCEVAVERILAWLATQSLFKTTLIVIKIQTNEFTWQQNADLDWEEVL